MYLIAVAYTVVQLIIAAIEGIEFTMAIGISAAHVAAIAVLTLHICIPLVAC
jgi:hypothetical protein